MTEPLPVNQCWVLLRDDLTYHRIESPCRVGNSTRAMLDKPTVCGKRTPLNLVDILQFTHMLPNLMSRIRMCQTCLPGVVVTTTGEALVGVVGYSPFEDVKDLTVERPMLALSSPDQTSVQVGIQPDYEANELSHALRIRQSGGHDRHLRSATAQYSAD